MSDPSGGGLDFVHRWIPAEGAGTTVLALHGTGGDENDLLPLAATVAAGKNVLSPRGKVTEMGAPRFFKRLAEGVFDVDDLVARTHELADFVGAAAGDYGFDSESVVALGYSNGANIAASMLLLRPEVLGGGALLRPMKPFDPEEVGGGLPDLASKKVLVSHGSHDPIVPRPSTEGLIELLRKAGAEVAVETAPAGHELVRPDVDVTTRWFDQW